MAGSVREGSGCCGLDRLTQCTPGSIQTQSLPPVERRPDSAANPPVNVVNLNPHGAHGAMAGPPTAQASLSCHIAVGTGQSVVGESI
jgi:hypothetical protein